MRGDSLKNRMVIILFALITIVTGCNSEHFEPINPHQSFIASVSILEPSITFFDTKGDEIARWNLDKAYTGATLIPHDRILIYGHQLPEADIYELSTGKKIKSIETGLGTTNAHYNDEEELLFLTNSVKNHVASYDQYGNLMKELPIGDYPMSMDSYKGKLYIINFKDETLSVIDMKSLELEHEWPISKSSNGLQIVEENNTIWIGGHGSGSQPNESVKVMNLENGQIVKEIKVSQMPVEFSKYNNEVYVINHGSNELVVCDIEGNILWRKEVGANPFNVKRFKQYVVVAGFDDHTIYFLKEGEIEHFVKTKNGPFHLLVREVQS